MSIKELIDIYERRIGYLNSVKASALSSGDVAQIAQADEEILKAQETLNKLRAVE